LTGMLRWLTLHPCRSDSQAVFLGESSMIHTDAMKIDELAYTLNNISTDDKKPITDYSAVEIVEEARYVLSLFVDPGQSHINHEALIGDEGEDQRKWAKQQVRQLKAFIKKYGQTA
jgi:hypothetical protein